MKKLLFALFAVLLLVQIKFSEIQSKYECDGVFSSADQKTAGKIFIELNEFRFWVHLWSESDGILYTEIPNELFYYYEEISDIGDIIQIYKDNSFVGQFSKLSKTLALKTPTTGFFDGTCKKLAD
jgi:hypothetical protein